MEIKPSHCVLATIYNLNKVENGFLKKVAKNLGISLESVSYVPRSEPFKLSILTTLLNLI